MTLLSIKFREIAIADILQIRTHLRDRATVELADRLLKAVENTTQQVRRYPHAGAIFRTQRARLIGMRWWAVAELPRYLLYYVTGVNRIEIVRVLYSVRDTNRQLRSP